MSDAERESRALYMVAIKAEFVAQHYLIGDSASEPEKHPHSHCYQVEVQLEGSTLNEQGYLVDIADIEHHLEGVLAYYRDKTLNELPEFRGLNPSIEHLARVLSRALSDRLSAPHFRAITVRVWEGPNAWTLYRQELPCASA